MAISQTATDIRGVLISVTGAQLLLPNATVSEVITYSPPEALPGSPDWMLGHIRWQGWNLPVVSLARMLETAMDEGEFGAKIVVLKALGGEPKHSFFALLAQGFPRLVTVSREGFESDDESAAAPVPEGALMRVRFQGDEVFIPDLASIEARIVALSARAA